MDQDEVPASTQRHEQIEEDENLSGGERYNPATGAILEDPQIDMKVPGYGGFIVRKVDTPTAALLNVLNVLAANLAVLEPLALEYEVLVVKLGHPPRNGFYVHRSRDGWTLAVPSATNKEQALLQITQALLAIARSRHAELLSRAHIVPYRE